jgi:hypothetical protein
MGESIPHALCRRRALYHSSIQRATRRRAWARVAKRYLWRSSCSRGREERLPDRVVERAGGASHRLPDLPRHARGPERVGVVLGQYTSTEFAQLCERHQVVRRWVRPGSAGTTPPPRGFFATLKRELLHRHPWPTRVQAQGAIVRWIEGWYNPVGCDTLLDRLPHPQREGERMAHC